MVHQQYLYQIISGVSRPIMCIVYIITVNAGYVSLLIPAMYIIPIMLYWHKAFVCFYCLLMLMVIQSLDTSLSIYLPPILSVS